MCIRDSGYGSGKFGRAINVKFGTGPFYVQNSKLTGTGNSSASGQGVYVSSGGNLTLINNQISGSTKDIVIDAGGTVNSSFNTYTSLTNNGTFRDVSSDLTTGNFLVSGNVGIGTTSPFSTLSITGKPGTSPFTVASSSGSTMFTMLENGNVGIGTSNPQYTIDIAGTINAIAIRTPYEHTITVAKAGGDYTTITEALNAITDNDATHLYHIKVMPGVYEESITMKPYVDISGSGENSTIISGTGGTVVTAAANSLLEKVKITRAAAGAVAGVSGSNADNFILRDVNINVTSTDNAAYGVSVDSGSANVVIEDVQMTVVGQGTTAAAYGIDAENTSVVYVFNSQITVTQTGNQGVSCVTS